ncbi:MAG: polysaccharide biosynthesis/export family protein, partial [Candidatus Auribacterota bacterium]|nr:polysaccharide biosynthesis/export family protein [Candidatus Auribacterota bacterium]
TAGRFGSFFLYLIPLFLIGVIALTCGCAGSSPHPADVKSEGEVQLFYSLPDREVAVASPTVFPRASPLPGTGVKNPELPDPDQSDAPPPLPNNTSDYLISPYDVIAISVLGEDDLSVTVRVSEGGAISFPLLGEVQTTGYTPIQFERRLEVLLEKDYLVSPSVNISILEYSTISVLGQVKKPGAYEIKGKITVSQAIALAGGLTKIASPNGTKVIRKSNGNEEVISIPLSDILGDGDLSGDISLKPGDLVVIPESFF